MHDLVLTVFALTGLLALVSLLLPAADRLAIPYAVLLAAVGCILGLLTTLVADRAGHGVFGDLVHALRGFNMTAEAFIYIFLPALLFETALNVDVRRLTEEVAPVLLMAVIGVIVSTFVVGYAVWAVSGIPLLACLMLGAILATTDPVAVVAIFRDIGAPRRLTVLVEGESLFNDAAAIALYTLLLAMLVGEHAARPLDGVLEFLRDFIGGLAAGVVAGWVACWVLPVLRDHKLAEATLTIALAYLIFILGDRYLGVSGVVAVVSAGLVVNYEGKRRLSPSSAESLRQVWQELGFWATSLIFLLAAMLVPSMLSDLRPRQLLYFAVVVVSAIGARAVILYVMMPVLSAAGLAERVRNDHKLVMLWGALRGAVSLALALAATQNAALPPALRALIGEQATGFVLFTLFVAAPTLRPLMRWLKLDQLSPADLSMRDRVMALTLSTIGEDIGAVAREHVIGADLVSRVAARYAQHADAAVIIAEENAQLPLAARLHTSLAILVEREQEIYLAYFDARTMSRRGVATLLSEVASLRDAVKAGATAEYRAAAAHNLGFTRTFRLALALQRYAGIDGPLARKLADRFETLLTKRVVIQALGRFNQEQIRRLFGDGPGDALAEELGLRRDNVEKGIDALMLQYPSYAQALHEQFLTVTALRLEEEGYCRLRQESVISQEVFDDLMRALHARRRAAEGRPRLDLGMESEKLVARVAMFSGIDPVRRNKICRLLRPRLAVPEERIVRKGDHGDTMYFISSGAVEVLVAPEPVRLGSGDFFGELALLDRRPRTADVVALGYCRLLSLSSRDFDRLTRTDEALREQVRAVADQRRGHQLAE